MAELTSRRREWRKAHPAVAFGGRLRDVYLKHDKLIAVGVVS
jgi:hypothetical protein